MSKDVGADVTANPWHEASSERGGAVAFDLPGLRLRFTYSEDRTESGSDSDEYWETITGSGANGTPRCVSFEILWDSQVAQWILIPGEALDARPPLLDHSYSTDMRSAGRENGSLFRVRLRMGIDVGPGQIDWKICLACAPPGGDSEPAFDPRCSVFSWTLVKRNDVFGNIWILSCDRCPRLWLCARFPFQRGGNGCGTWYAAEIDRETAAALRHEDGEHALTALESAGSYWWCEGSTSTEVRRGRGRIAPRTA